VKSQNSSQSVVDQSDQIKLLLMDCDGVLTDGRLYFSESGETMKVFDVRDGQGIASWHAAGFKSGIISGRGAEEIIKKRAQELGVEYVKTKSSDKAADVREIAEAAGVALDHVAFVGDDIGDLEAMKIVGLPIAVADAVAETKASAAYVTNARGGRGAIREVTDLLLNSR